MQEKFTIRYLAACAASWYNRFMNMKKLLHWKYLFFTLAALMLAAALATLPLGFGETRAEPSPTPNPWSKPPSETPSPTEEPDWAPDLNTFQPVAHTGTLYEAALSIVPYSSTISGKLRISYVNASSDVLYALKLHLHANDVSQGCFSLSSVAVNGERVYYALSGENGGILTVPLPLEIAPGESAELFLNFTISVPRTGSRFGLNDTGLMLGNFLPIMAVYENGAWHTDPYTAEGDPFYSETADYRVAITFPKTHVLSHTGSKLEETENYYEYTYYIAAPRVRDFALALIPGGKTATAQSSVGRTTVKAVAGTQSAADFCAEVAVDALDFYNRTIGLYPYAELSVVPFDQSGGMEYPSLIMISSRYLRSDSRAMGELVIAHEVAHQWFYSVVGSDQINAPWLDESLVEFLAFRYYAEHNGEEAAEALWNERFSTYATAERDTRLDASLYEFEGDAYFTTVYAHGAALFRALWEEVGDTAFFGALRIYFDANSFENATFSDLLAAFEEAIGRDFTAWFETRMAPGYVFPYVSAPS